MLQNINSYFRFDKIFFYHILPVRTLSQWDIAIFQKDGLKKSFPIAGVK